MGMARKETGRRDVSEAARIDRVAHVANGMNQRRITDLSSEPANEYFDQLGIILMRVFPNALAQLGARENTARLPHEHL